MYAFLETLVSRQSQLMTLAGEHIKLTTIAILIAVVIGVPLGIFITRNKRLASIVIGAANIMQAIPSMALLGFLIPFVGIGATPAIIMVVLYSMLPILKNTHAGITNIDPSLIEVSKGIGLTSMQTLRLVKLPLAVPIIMTGIRISAVTAVGLMTIAAFIGAGGFGLMVFSGIESLNNNLILLGAIPAALLALAIDLLVGKIENQVVPNGLPTAKGSIKRKEKGSKKVLIGLSLAFAVMLGFFAMTNLDGAENQITVGSKAFTEQEILGNILADLIEARTDIRVNRQLNLGGTQVTWEAMTGGHIDLYVEYSGTAYAAILGHSLEGDKNATEVYNTVVADLKARYNMVAFAPLGFNNTYVIVVTPEFAATHGLITMSDFARISQNHVFAPTIEFVERPDGLNAMSEAYGMDFADIIPMRGSLRYTAVLNDEAQATSGFATDGIIERYGLVMLEDDLEFFLPFYAFIMMRAEAIEKFPEVKPVLMELEGVLTPEIMQSLNARVDIDHHDPAVVAREFLIESGLIE